MSRVRRVYVEKKPEFAGAARDLSHEIRHYMGVSGVTGVRILIRYDVENVSDEVFEEACHVVFAEPPVDILYEETFPMKEGSNVFSVEYLPGQFDQRADSAVQCIRFLKGDEEPVIRTATTYVIEGDVSDADLDVIRHHCINPVDSREAAMAKPDTLVMDFPEPADIKVFDGFISMNETSLRELYDSLNLAMTFKDFLFIQNYFSRDEKRDPTLTEIRVLDTYWSDHCRHTTFATELKNVKFGNGDYAAPIEATWDRYRHDYDILYKGRDDKYICLMDLACLGAKVLKKQGKLTDQEESDEINACSIIVPVDVDGKYDEWLINFKNETHNHPTEIEPFGGAATCLGGAIRDPLSGRTYVYQAMRVTGAADPTRPVSETLEGKLPQKTLTREAAHGYSSYGNQIGLATGYVKEIYHPNYVAKRMEIGAVMGAAPRKNVERLNSDPGDIIILLGGRTGRDGIGGATGSSKIHTTESLETCGAEVQKGNAPTERKLQRMFRRPEVSEIIKKCNDFGAGGVSVAIGELAPGLTVDLDKVPKKYAGLDGTELAISESQERMAVVVSPEDADKFLDYAAEENLEAVKVAVVTKEPRLVLNWRGKDIVNISRAFLDTNGAHQETDVKVDIPNKADSVLKRSGDIDDVKAKWLDSLKDLNACSQKGLVEMFDSSIGAATVDMPYGGKYQMTQTQTMVAKLPVHHGDTDVVTMMSYGFDPYLSSWSPYHGAIYAVTQSVAKVIAAGGSREKMHFTFQEYFRRMNADPKRWSQPFAALLGAYDAQLGFGIAAIGGKDSMSGTFDQIDVPPTLVSFCVDIDKVGHVITDEIKDEGDVLVEFRINRDDYDIPVYADVLRLYDRITSLIREGRIKAAYAEDSYGAAPAAAQMAFGNHYGVHFDGSLEAADLFENGCGCILAEMTPDDADVLEDMDWDCGDYRVIGTVSGRDQGGEAYFDWKNSEVPLSAALKSWTGTLEKVFPTRVSEDRTEIASPLYDTKDIYVCRSKVARPTVFIPVFPGTNCEFDCERSFEKAGADVDIRVFRNRTADDIVSSVASFAEGIRGAQIVMFPGGFSAGDEPDGSAKFFATAFRNEKIRDAIEDLLNHRDGLVLGICNGFQALIKLGLVPNGRITGQDENAPTLTFNTIGRHISREAYIRVVSNKSPWLMDTDLGGVYVNPASHGEGRFVAPEETIEALLRSGQVATQYCDPEGTVSMDEEWNFNGSYHAIEGITSPDGRVLGKMCHSERRGDGVAVNIVGRQDMKIFESGVRYFL